MNNRAMGKWIAGTVSAIIATIIGGIILNVINKQPPPSPPPPPPPPPFEWTDASNATVNTTTEKVPTGAFKAGYNGPTPAVDSLYVCRGEHENGVHPGKLFDRWCNISWGGKEVRLDEYEVLVTDSGEKLSWEESATGKPKENMNIVEGGSLDSRSGGYNNYSLGVCRAKYQNGIHPGKLWMDKCHIGWGGKEVELQEYEVLTEDANR